METTIERPRDLSYATVVTRERVHRDAVCEVFVTDAEITLDGLVAAIQLPRAHAYYSDHVRDAEAYDPLLLTEAFRQVAILVAHEQVGAPVGSKFIFEAGTSGTASPGALAVVPGVQRLARISGHIIDSRSRNDQTVGLTLELSLFLDDVAAATMRLEFQWMTTRLWDVMRNRGRQSLDLTVDRAHPIAHRLDPASVARVQPSNVVLGRFERSRRGVDTQVVVDQNHPSLFDHPLDHIPGAVMFEALRQSGVVACHEMLGLSPKFISFDTYEVKFSRFGEFELPTDCHVELVRNEGRLAVFAATIRQDDQVITTAELTFTHQAPFTTEVTP